MPESHDAAAVAAKLDRGDQLLLDTSRPTNVLRELAARDHIPPVSIFVYGFQYTDTGALAHLASLSQIDVRLSMVPPSCRQAVAAGDVSYLPRSLHATACNLARIGTESRTVAIVSVPAPPERAGAPPFSERTESIPLGPTSAFGVELLEIADVGVLEVDAGRPQVSERRRVPLSAVDYLVKVDGTPPLLSSRSLRTAEATIAERLCSVLPPTPTIQLGLGTIPRAFGNHLAETWDGGEIDVWTGLLGDGLRAVLDAGLTGSVTTAVGAGTDPEHAQWLAARDDVTYAPVTRTHDPSEVAAQDNVVAINAALQVDLTGAVNAEAVGDRTIGGIGGHTDFMTGASTAPDALAVVALTSRTASGVKKLVPSLKAAPTTTPRQAVDLVVTEFGVADLRGASLAERRAALVAVAHPDYRADLSAAVDRS